MSENQLLAMIRRDAKRISKSFRLKYLAVEKELPQVRRRFGSCDESKLIRIRLHKLRDGRFLTYPHLIHTLCHEMAHLKFMDHGKEFKNLNSEILDWAKQTGIYRPWQG